MATAKNTSKIKTPSGYDMDYKVEKLSRKTAEHKSIEKELKKKATKPSVRKK
jgi:hypothetical protein